MSKNIKTISPDFSIERSHSGIVCGIDEVGRGPLAGPVLSACVHIPNINKDHDVWNVIKDSKKLTVKKREALFIQIRELTDYGIGMASHDEIDQINIHQATLLAMKRAFESMLKHSDIMPDVAIVDGKFTPDIRCETQAVIKGDTKSISIAAASILAKVTRDRIMSRLDGEHPYYGWSRNSGYGTAEHMNALNSYGASPYHRQSFAPVKKVIENKV
jgi:ribonuclease HII